MQLKVGMALRWKDQVWVCTRMDKYEGIYKECSNHAEWSKSIYNLTNVVLVGPIALDLFDVGDIVHRKEVRAVLETEDGRFFHIYTHLTIKLLVKGNQSGTTGSTRHAEAQTEQAEATWGQLGSWESSWLEGVGEASDAVDGVRSVQQDVGNSGTSEERVHAIADNGDSGADRTEGGV